ncbi:MAG: alcohol dehydrogenase catalytic domain-containing protein [Ardenticatenaceae bacterium]|nr:alcohol dehydrogenase catalytic domain-containing protein [Anaerolineales bacterium]MCB8920553.1 alcohol dehydrogenase catalytic domain-containing protein [Ardenticatenaceae bacterium]
MKALVFHEHGDLNQTAVANIPQPEIGPNDVLLQVKAAALNRLDLWVLAGWPGLNLKLPHVMGSDGAGIVAAVGADVQNVQVGDRVAVNPTVSCGQCAYCQSGRDNMCDHFAILGEHLDGFAAEYTAVPAKNLIPLPDHIPFEAAAAASLVYVTAWHSLITVGKLQAGESVLVVGAGGGVNTAVIQIAKLAGANPIYVVGSNADKLARAQELGADVLINRQEENWGKAIFKATNRQGVDVVVDNVGAATYHASLRSLKKGGRLLTVGNTSGPKFELDNRLIFGKHLQILGSTMGPHSDYVKVMEMVFNGRLHPVIDTIYPLQNGPTALQHLQDGDVAGKLVLIP